MIALKNRLPLQIIHYKRTFSNIFFICYSSLSFRIKIWFLFYQNVLPISSSKKRDLSDKSQHGKNPKNLRQGSSNSYAENFFDVFALGLESDES